MYPNKESGLGSKMANALFDNAMFNNATTGRVFIVAKSGITNESEIKAIYGNTYSDGTPVIYTTLTLALASCVASRGDLILVAPGHTETIVGAAGVSVATAGVTIVGLGKGALRPMYTFTTSAAASFDVSAASVTVRNLLFVCGIDNQTAVNNVTATDVTFDQCEWTISNGTVGAALGILTAATATRLTVSNSRFIGPATNAGTTCAAAIQHESGVDYQIVNNYFAGKMTQAIKNVATVLRGVIDNNKFVIGTGTVAITMAAASTPFITNNRMNVASGTTPITAAAGFVAGNIYSAAAGVTSTGQTASTATVSTL
jgi:hypothetical protein